MEQLVGPLFVSRDRSRFWVELERALFEEVPLDRFDEWRALWRCLWLAAMSLDRDRAYRLLADHERLRRQRGHRVEGDDLLYQCCRLGLAYNFKERERCDELYESIAWDRLPPWPLLRALRLRMAVSRNRSAEVNAALRSGVGAPLRSEDRAQYLRILADYFRARGCAGRAEALNRRAAEALSGQQDMCARVQRAQDLALTAHAAVHARKPIEDCTRLFAQAQAADARFSTPALSLHVAWILTEILIQQGRHVEARRRAQEIVRAVEKEPAYRTPLAFFALSALANLVDCDVALGDLRRAGQRVRTAAAVLRRSNTAKYRGIFHCMRGNLFAARPKRGGARRAFAEYDLAEQCFLQHGDSFELGLSEVELARGRLLERLQKAEQALECTSRVACLSDPFVGGAWLELKSRLLLSPALPNRHRLYEDILANLGLAWGPAPLFKVVANLYMYTWELGEELELTDYHLKQVNRMAAHLDGPTYRRLYNEHVTLPVIRRAMEKNFGLGGGN